MKNTFGSQITLTLFGESHGPAVGAVLDGLAPGMPVNEAAIREKMELRKAADACEKKGVHYKVGNMFSSDKFYDDANSGMDWAKMGVLGVEMECAALYCNAARLGKKALTICTVSDSFVNPENTTAEERQTSFTDMMEIALEIA